MFVLDVATAAKLAGLGRTAAYQRARAGELLPGVRVLRVGRKLLVPVAPLAAALGVSVEELRVAAETLARAGEARR